MKKSLPVFLLLAVSTPALAADLTVTYKYKGGGSGERIQYYTDNYQFTVDKGMKQDTLVDIREDTTYLIDHRSKTIQVMNMKQMAGMMGEMQGMKLPGSDKTMAENQQASMKKLYGDPKEAQLQKLGPQQIAGRTCEGYRVERKGHVHMIEEVCVDATLRPPGNISASQEQMGQMAKGMMGSMESYTSSAQTELHSLPGFVLKRLTKVKGSESLEEVTQIQEGPIDVALFKLPEGYQRIDQAADFQRQMQEAQQQMQKIRDR